MPATVAKASGYAVLTAPATAVAKAQAYVVLSSEVNISISKACVYVVVSAQPPIVITPNHGPSAGGNVVTITGVQGA